MLTIGANTVSSFTAICVSTPPRMPGRIFVGGFGSPASLPSMASTLSLSWPLCWPTARFHTSLPLSRSMA